MSELYLGAHVVRGALAFDVMEEIEIGSEQGWIVPTSGHRAYPFWVHELEFCFVNNQHENPMEVCGAPPPEQQDHYALSAAPKGQGLIKNLAERLGFVPKPPTISRR